MSEFSPTRINRVSVLPRVMAAIVLGVLPAGCANEPSSELPTSTLRCDNLTINTNGDTVTVSADITTDESTKAQVAVFAAGVYGPDGEISSDSKSIVVPNQTSGAKLSLDVGDSPQVIEDVSAVVLDPETNALADCHQ